MPRVLILFFIFVICELLSKGTKAAKKQKKQESYSYRAGQESQQTAAYSRTKKAVDAGRQSIAARAQNMKYRATHADEGYDEHILDFCDSSLPDTRGITFRGLPEGADELLYLRRFNHQREKALERALMSRESEMSQR